MFERIRAKLGAVIYASALVACGMGVAHRNVLSVWLQDGSSRTLELARTVRLNSCHGVLLSNGPAGQYQEWGVGKTEWAGCLLGLHRLGAQTSFVPVDWLYSIRKRVNVSADDRSILGQFVVDVPDFRAKFLHLTSQGLKSSLTLGVQNAHFDGHLQPIYVMDVNGKIVAGTLQEVWLDEVTGRFNFYFSFEGHDGGTISAGALGSTGAFALKGNRYDLEPLTDGTQVVTVRPSVPFEAHSELHAGGIFYDAADSGRVTEAALTNLSAYVAVNPEAATEWRGRGMTKPSCVAPYKAPPPSREVIVKVLFVYADDTALPGAMKSQGEPDLITALEGSPVAPSWNEIAASIAMDASDAFRRQGLSTRVVSVGAVPLQLSEEYWDTALREAYSKAPVQYPYLDQLDMYAEMMVLAQGVKPEKERETVMANAISADHQLRMQFDSLKTILNGTRLEKGADIVALIAGGRASTAAGTANACGTAATIRATFGTAFLAVRLDCALLNHSFIHELGHLLGARHERDLYRCLIDPSTGARIADGSYRDSTDSNECDLDDQDYGKCTHLVGPPEGPKRCAEDAPDYNIGSATVGPASWRNRAYIDEHANIGTVMSSGSSRSATFSAYFGAINQGYVRRPFWSSVNPRSFDGVDVSDGSCCDDGAIIDAYAASCVGTFDASTTTPSNQLDNTWNPVDSGEAKAAALDMTKLQATFTFPYAAPAPGHMREMPNSSDVRLIALELKKQRIRRFYVEGFGDAVQDRAANFVISQRRAMAAATILCEADPEALVFEQGYGRSELEVPEREGIPEVRNRRVLISWPAEGLTRHDRPLPTKPCTDFLSQDVPRYEKSDGP